MRAIQGFLAFLVLVLIGCNNGNPVESGKHDFMEEIKVTSVTDYSASKWSTDNQYNIIGSLDISDDAFWGDVNGTVLTTGGTLEEYVEEWLGEGSENIEVNTSWGAVKQLFRPCDPGGEGGESPPEGGGEPEDPPSG